MQADKLYADRADLSKTHEGIGLLHRATALDTGSYEAAWRLSRFDYFLGDHTKDKSERDRAFNEGVEAGRRAVKLDGERYEFFQDNPFKITRGMDALSTISTAVDTASLRITSHSAPSWAR